MPGVRRNCLESSMTEPLQSPNLPYRMGAAAVGMFAGVAFGALLGVITIHIAPFVFGGAFAGIVTGLAFPELAIRGAEATFHFFAGLLGGVRGLAHDDLDEISAPDESSRDPWLKAAFTFGVVFSLVIALLLRF